MEDKDNEEIYHLLQKYLAGNCTKEETAIVVNWYNSFNDETNHLSAADEKALIAAINKNVLAAVADDKKNVGYFFYHHTKLVAAACFIIIVCAIAFITYTIQKQAPAFIQITAEKGEQKSFVLDDSTMVKLNSSSVLKIASDYNKTSRNVELEGEAFFNVKHDNSKPFTIVTKDFITKDVGTSFNIKSYKEDSIAELVVSTGKVLVALTEKNQANSYEVLPNQSFHFNTSLSKGFITSADTLHALGWLHDELYFDAASIQQIMKVIERTYNVTTDFAGNKNEGGRYTISFNKKQPVTELMQLLAQLTGIQYKMDKNRITINMQYVQ